MDTDTEDHAAVVMGTEDHAAVVMETEDRLRQLLLDLKNDMTSDDLESLKFRQNIPAGIKEELRKPLDAWDYYEREGEIDYLDEERTLAFLTRLLDPSTFGGSRRLFGHVQRYQEKYGLAPVNRPPGEDVDTVDGSKHRPDSSTPSRHGARSNKKSRSRFFISLFSCVRKTGGKSSSKSDAPVTLSTLSSVPNSSPIPLQAVHEAETFQSENLETDSRELIASPQLAEPLQKELPNAQSQTIVSESQDILLTSKPVMTETEQIEPRTTDISDNGSEPAVVTANELETKPVVASKLAAPGDKRELPTLRGRLFIFP